MHRFLAWCETRKGFLVAVAVLAFGMALLRLVHITYPPDRVFDEVYSPKFAWQFIHGETFFDVHPILAELPHSIGLLLFGDTPLGWRFSPWIWNIVFVWASAFAAYFLSGRRLVGVVMATLVSLDTAYFIYGRTGLPDMFMLSQLALAMTFFFGSMRAKHRGKAIAAALIAGVFLGDVVSTKWLGLASLGSVWAWVVLQAIQQKRQHSRPHIHPALLPNIPWWLYPIAFLLIPALMYAIWLLVLVGLHGTPAEIWGRITEWHSQVYNYHAHLKATHPYSSKWWEWPLLLHPVLFYWKQGDDGLRVINATGNIFLWWSGFAGLFVGAGVLFRRYWPEVLWAIVSVLGFWLPWAYITRVSFNYHYFSSYFFELLLLSLGLTYLLDRPKYRPYAWTFFGIAIAFFILLYPIATALPLPNNLPPQYYYPF